jgi:hypothetical protein
LCSKFRSCLFDVEFFCPLGGGIVGAGFLECDAGYIGRSANNCTLWRAFNESVYRFLRDLSGHTLGFVCRSSGFSQCAPKRFEVAQGRRAAGRRHFSVVKNAERLGRQAIAEPAFS